MQCQECSFQSKSLRGLSSHIRQRHNISMKEYYDKYMKSEGDGICKLNGCNNKTTFMGLMGHLDCCCTSHATNY